MLNQTEFKIIQRYVQDAVGIAVGEATGAIPRDAVDEKWREAGDRARAAIERMQHLGIKTRIQAG